MKITFVKIITKIIRDDEKFLQIFVNISRQDC